MYSATFESVDYPSAFVRKTYERKTTGADHRLDSFSSAEKVTGFWAVGLWCCAGSARLLGNCNREN